MFFGKTKNILIVADNISKYYAIDINNGELIWVNNNSSPFNSQIKIYKVVDSLKEKKNLDLYVLYNKSSKENLKKSYHSFFLDFNYLKFIPFNNKLLKKVNLFISSYVNYVFPPNSKNIYICHDIADAPMVNKI